MRDEPPHSPPKFLDCVRSAIRVRHYSRRTEEAYVHWIRRHILFHNKKHPSAMGGEEINAFLTHESHRPRGPNVGPFRKGTRLLVRIVW